MFLLACAMTGEDVDWNIVFSDALIMIAVFTIFGPFGMPIAGPALPLARLSWAGIIKFISRGGNPD